MKIEVSVTFVTAILIARGLLESIQFSRKVVFKLKDKNSTNFRLKGVVGIIFVKCGCELAVINGKEFFEPFIEMV